MFRPRKRKSHSSENLACFHLESFHSLAPLEFSNQCWVISPIKEKISCPIFQVKIIKVMISCRDRYVNSSQVALY